MKKYTNRTPSDFIIMLILALLALSPWMVIIWLISN